MNKREIKRLAKALMSIRTKYPYSRIEVDVWPIGPKGAIKNILFVHHRKYKINRKSRSTVRFMPYLHSDISDGEIMARTPIMYKKNESML